MIRWTAIAAVVGVGPLVLLALFTHNQVALCSLAVVTGFGGGMLATWDQKRRVDGGKAVAGEAAR